MDVMRAANSYAHGRSLRQIGAELGVSRTTVSEQLRQAGVTIGRGSSTAESDHIDMLSSKVLRCTECRHSRECRQ